MQVEKRIAEDAPFHFSQDFTIESAAKGNALDINFDWLLLLLTSNEGVLI